MTEISRPWAGTTIGDAGPYTAIQWWDAWQALAGGSGYWGDVGDVGVFPMVPNQLYVTSPDENVLRIDYGAALIDGLCYFNNGAISNFAVASASAGSVRDDRLVVRKFFSPAVQTARITLLAGGEEASPGPGTPPALIQDVNRVTYWDMPLARVSITDAGVITLTDERSWVGCEFKWTLFPAYVGYDSTSAAAVQTSQGATDVHGVPAVDTHNVSAIVNFSVPGDAVHNITSNVIFPMWMYMLVMPNASGNIYARMRYRIGPVGGGAGDHVDHTAGIPLAAEAVTNAKYCVVQAHVISGAEIDDQVLVFLDRDSTNALDTIGNTVWLRGVWLGYWAYL